ncbi:MAG: hypothetical protein GXO79_09025, partial [Chlorobi bacterium]|nr:hypothetical protein [Chlorobiota bacterium]
SGNIFIGRSAGWFEQNSNRLIIENTEADENGALIYGEFDSDYLRFNARVGIGMRAESDANLSIEDTNGLASIKIRGTGDSYNYSRLVLESKESVNKFWQLAHKKNNDYSVVYYDGSSFLSRFQIFAAGGAKLYYGGLVVDSTITANKLESQGGLSAGLNSITGNYTATVDDYTILASTSSSDITISLPAASTVKNQIFVIKKTDSNAYNVIIDGSGSETIDGAATQSLTAQFMAYTIQSDGSNWYIIGKLN